jgi:hypothetical protein
MTTGTWAGAVLAQTPACMPARVPMAYMHSHFGVLGMQRPPKADVASDMRANCAMLVAWKVVADSPWIVATPTGIVQRAVPRPDEP